MHNVLAAPRHVFAEPVVRGRFLRRYKRFFVDVDIDGVVHTAHTANTGAMTGLQIEGAPVLLTRHDGTKRKLPLEVEAIHVGSSWVVCNTIRANRVAGVFLRAGVIDVLGSDVTGTEVKVDDSRIDFRVGVRLVEVKSVTLRGVFGAHDDVGLFPDAVSERALKHAQLLQNYAPNSAALFLCQRADVSSVAPAVLVQPAYADALRRARDAGVLLIAARVVVDESIVGPTGEPGAALAFGGLLPVLL